PPSADFQSAPPVIVHQFWLSMKLVRSQLVLSGGGVGRGVQVKPPSDDSTCSDGPLLQLASAITPFPGTSITDEEQANVAPGPDGRRRSRQETPPSVVRRTAGTSPPEPTQPSFRSRISRPAVNPGGSASLNHEATVGRGVDRCRRTALSAARVGEDPAVLGIGECDRAQDNGRYTETDPMRSAVDCAV